MNNVQRVLAAGMVAVLALIAAPAEAAAGGRSKASARSRSSKTSKASAKSSSRDKRSKASAKNAPKLKGRMSKAERLAAVRAARRAAEERRRAELARIAAIRRADEAMRDTAAINIAQDDVTREDPQVRRAALAALGSRAGAVVVMDPNTGRVLSIVNQRMAVGSSMKPCSTFKPVVALAAMRENLMTEGDAIHLRACNCDYDLDDALAYSNNEYFQRLGRQIGLEKFVTHARDFGFGQATGINLPGETPGVLPAEVPSDGVGRVFSHGDGIRITALQLASFVSAVANGGSLYQPQVVAPGRPFTPVLRRQLKLNPEYRRSVLEGMVGAVNYGTAKKAYAADQVAGKTGSCIELGSWNGLFASFSSVENPNLVVVVVTRGSMARGARAADVAGQIYRSLGSRYGSLASRPRRVDGASTMTNE
jgi:penicillin-binding protein 2